MKQKAIVAVLSLLLVATLGTRAQDGDAPQDVGTQEKVTVSLVQVDALVVDKKGNSVPNLTKDDFELLIGDKPYEIATLDVECPIGAAPDPLPIKDKTAPPPIGPGAKRRIVFAFDYYFLTVTMRPQLLQAAKSMLEFAKTEDEEVMIVAMAYGLRVEQKFTSDLRQLIAALTRMEHDNTLWPRIFNLGSNSQEYFDDITTLMDVLSAYDGPKGVVLFSQARHIPTPVLDIPYNTLAMHALSARAAIYPANPDLLWSNVGGADSLVRMANQSGGNMPFYTSDTSVPYRRAQRDMSCRYTLGAYINEEEGLQRRAVRVNPKNNAYSARNPTMLKLFSEKEIQDNRARAAFVDPGPYENPLVRAYAYPMFPANKSKWDTLVTLTFPMPVGPDGADLNVSATMKRGVTRVDKMKRDLHVDPPPGGGDTRQVTLFGDTTLKDGDHTFTVVLTEPAENRVVSAEARFSVPQVLEDLLILRGPVFARTVPGGVFVRADDDKGPDTKLDEVLGEDKSFEPLVVAEIESSDELLYYWTACVLGKLDLKDPAVVKRALLNDDGEVVHMLEEIPLKLEPVDGYKNLQCHVELQSVPAGRIPPGEYQADITIGVENGALIAHSRAPLHVKPPAN